MKKYIALLGLILVACGGGGGGGESHSWNGALNSAGFPNVAGTYAIVNTPHDATCTDGSGGPGGGQVSENLTITQNANSITGTTTAALPAGTTVVSSSTPTGNVDKNGMAILNSSYIATSSMFSGQAIISQNATFQFTSTGISGSFISTITSSTISGSCSEVVSVSGSKI